MTLFVYLWWDSLLRRTNSWIPMIFRVRCNLFKHVHKMTNSFAAFLSCISSDLHNSYNSVDEVARGSSSLSPIPFWTSDGASAPGALSNDISSMLSEYDQRGGSGLNQETCKYKEDPATIPDRKPLPKARRKRHPCLYPGCDRVLTSE
jgi:hypothetical protein